MLLTVVVVSITSSLQAAKNTDKTTHLPNIIFIMVDDMGYHDLGCYGSKTILTPISTVWPKRVFASRIAIRGIQFAHLPEAH